MNESKEITQLPNLGPKSAAMLARAGIDTCGQVAELGAVVTFLAVRQSGQNPSWNLLWALAAGLQRRHWTSLTAEEKQSLRDEIDELTR